MLLKKKYSPVVLPEILLRKAIKYLNKANTWIKLSYIWIIIVFIGQFSYSMRIALSLGVSWYQNIVVIAIDLCSNDLAEKIK